MSQSSIECKSSFGDSVGLTFRDDIILIDAYLRGSIAGGTGTEEKAEISGAKLQKLLAEYNVKSPAELSALAQSLTPDEMDKFLLALRKYQDITFIWSETDWSDDK